MGRSELPSIAIELLARLRILDVGGQLKRLAAFLGCGHKPDKLERLAPQILFATPRNVLQPAGRPIRDGSEKGGSLGGAPRPPQIGYNGLAGGRPAEAMSGNRERVRADVLAET